MELVMTILHKNLNPHFSLCRIKFAHLLEWLINSLLADKQSQNIHKPRTSLAWWKEETRKTLLQDE